MHQKKHLSPLLGLALAVCIASGTASAASAITEMGGDVAVAPASPGSTGQASFAGPENSLLKSGSEFTVTFAPPSEEQKQAPAPDKSKSGGSALAGIGLKSDSPDIDLQNLKWIHISDGRQAARLRIHSQDAESVRAALVFSTDSGELPDAFTLHFKGADADIFEVTGKELKNNELYWSPIVIGDAVTVEVVLPAGLSPESLHLAVPQLSWFGKPYKTTKAGGYREDFGTSQSCERDAVCSVQKGNPAYDNAINAVAKTFHTESDGYTYYCTGTLLNNSNSPKRQLFWSAAHCAHNQADANTYQTVWFYATTQCGGNASTLDPRVAVLTGGATILHRDGLRDTLLLELKRTPPAGVFYQGWNAQQIASGVDIHDLHHPNGDALKYSQGNVTGLGFTLTDRDGKVSNTNMIRVQWPTAVVEHGSSGSGLLTLASDGNYQLRGGLTGGPSTCSADTNNRRDYFSDFSGVFQQISGYFTR